MFGGIPKIEIDELNDYFEVFNTLREQLFTDSSTPYVDIKTEDIKLTIESNKEVINFKDSLNKSLLGSMIFIFGID